jgi:hypothetical protein
MDLAQNDPEKFERLRERYTREFIRSVPSHLRPRIKGLQFEIDNRRRLAKTPLAACICISEMMKKAFFELNRELNQPAVNTNKPHHDNNIIPFQPH